VTRSHLTLGASFIGLGILLLLDEVGLVAAGPILASWWPTVVIFAGLARFLTRPRNPAAGVVLLAVGGALLLWTNGIVDSLALLGPTVLIGLGTWLLVRRPGSRPTGRFDEWGLITVFDDRRLRAPAGPLDGRSVTTIFGDVDLDLRAATVEARATLTITTIFGDVDLVVPDDWAVTVSGPEIFGGVHTQLPEESPEGAPVLHLQVVTIFGDIDVRRAPRGVRPPPGEAPSEASPTATG
jgi:hypothetical protein